jgi:hypothetical protein
MIEPRMTHDEAVELAGLYVLGALERTEEAAVREHLATCSERHPEVEALGSVVPALSADGLELIEPPASLGDRIMTAAAADLAADPRGAAARASGSVLGSAALPTAAAPASPAGSASPSGPVPASEPLAFPSAAERTARAERTPAGRTTTSRFDWALRIAAVLAIVAVGAWGLNLQGQLDNARRFEGAVATVLQVAAQPGAKVVALKPGDNATASGIGAVAADGSVVLAMRDLAPTSGAQVYEAWVIVGDAAPLAVGGFAVGGTGTASFTTRPAATPAGAVIALTLEPNAGNTAPMGPVVSVGVAAAPPGQEG